MTGWSACLLSSPDILETYLAEQPLSTRFGHSDDGPSSTHCGPWVVAAMWEHGRNQSRRCWMRICYAVDQHAADRNRCLQLRPRPLLQPRAGTLVSLRFSWLPSLRSHSSRHRITDRRLAVALGDNIAAFMDGCSPRWVSPLRLLFRRWSLDRRVHGSTLQHAPQYQARASAYDPLRTFQLCCIQR